jgi:chaperonin GroEL
VDDAVCAVKSALEEGILPGGGLSLYHLGNEYEVATIDEENLEKKIAYAILAKALQSPLEQILSNAGYENVYLGKKTKQNEGFDVKNERWGNMYDMGIIDPMKVTRSALQNAISVAVTLLSTNAIVTIKRKQDANI